MAEKFSHWSIKGKDCEITLEKRPHYCDRGNYLAKIFANNQFVLWLDQADGWPRYYFLLENAKVEILEWLKKRQQYINSDWNEVYFD